MQIKKTLKNTGKIFVGFLIWVACLTWIWRAWADFPPLPAWVTSSGGWLGEIFNLNSEKKDTLELNVKKISLPKDYAPIVDDNQLVTKKYVQTRVMAGGWSIGGEDHVLSWQTYFRTGWGTNFCKRVTIDGSGFSKIDPINYLRVCESKTGAKCDDRGNCTMDGDNIQKVVLGTRSGCMLLTTWKLKCWGIDQQGQVGDGEPSRNMDFPTDVEIEEEVQDIVLSPTSTHVCAVLNTGTVKCWGENYYGQLGDGTTTNRFTPVSVSGLSNVKKLVLGYDYACAVLNTGTVKCWGRNYYGQLGDGTTTNRLTPSTVLEINNATNLYNNKKNYSICALLETWEVKCWGLNNYGQLGDGTTTNRTTPVSVSGVTWAKQVVLSNDFTCALLNSWEVKCWGINNYGQLGDGTLSGYSVNLPTQVLEIDNAINLWTTNQFTCALLDNGKVKCWGRGMYGEMGNGSQDTYNPKPVEVSGITDAVKIMVSDIFACAVLEEGNIKCWWKNKSVGNLGIGSYKEEIHPFPQYVREVESAVDIVNYQDTTCFISEAGGFACWGANTTYSLFGIPIGDGSQIKNPSAYPR